MAPPARTKSRHACRPPRTRPSRCVASVSTASVLATGPSQDSKKRRQRSWSDWLRSRSDTSAPVSRRSSPAMLEGAEDVFAMLLREVRYPGLQRPDERTDPIDRTAAAAGGRPEELLKRESDDLRGSAL